MNTNQNTSKNTNQNTAVIFDLDGTLLDTCGDLCAAANYALAEEPQAKPLDPSLPEVQQVAGEGSIGLLRYGLGITGAITDPPNPTQTDTLKRLTKKLLGFYETNYCVHTRSYEGALELLATLKQQGIKTGILTNKYQHLAQKVVAELAIEIDALVGATPDLRKPDPAFTQLIFDKLNTTATDAIFIGDSLKDRDTANAVGMPFISAAYGFGKLAEPPLIANSIADLKTHILEWLNNHKGHRV